MVRVRSPAVAGSFYPAAAPVLAQQIDHFVERAPACQATRPAAFIVPHAGYVYSGSVAASAYACLRQLRGQVRHVLLLGPCHFVPMHGLAHPDTDALRTPLGDVPLDDVLLERAEATHHVLPSSLAHHREHSLEVQLPFLQRVLGDFDVLPLVVGTASAEEVADVLDTLWMEDVLPIISSDLSHSLPYETARKVDQETAQHILELDGPLDDERACGATAINGLLHVARRRGLRAELLDLRNSGDTAGDRREVVGYGAFAFYPGA
jgi:hypothetical protein